MDLICEFLIIKGINWLFNHKLDELRAQHNYWSLQDE